MMFLGLLLISSSGAVKLTVVNNCSFRVWPGVQPNGGHNVLLNGGFALNPSEAKSVDIGATYWTGRVWARTGCDFDLATGRGGCKTGDCAGLLACNGLGGATPATLAQLTLNNRDGLSSYSVSVVDGFNLPVMVTPAGGKGQCTPAGCSSRALVTGGGCPRELRVVSAAGETVACNSACRAFGLDVFCCTNAFGSREACQPTLYSLWFKKECPGANTFAHDDPAADFTCSAPAEMRLTFCP
ncbi:hypothetical protein SUGI_0018060 [Cryptomeria japonica]|nr:hypothetical protein SUGI_0018060 [Cryptomeria japonica]